MNKIFKFYSEASNVVSQYFVSLYGGFKNRRLFDDIKTCCLFIGYSNCGKTLIRSLLDAHPNIIMADRFSVLKYTYAGFSRNQICYLLLKSSQEFAKAGRISKKGDSYKVANQWQGRFKKLQVFGDDRGEGATLRLQARPWLLNRLHKVTGVKVKFIHVVRNPYDKISDRFKRIDRDKRNLTESIEHYFSLYETGADIKSKIKSSDLFELRYESFVKSPKIYLKKLCHFVGVDAPNDYLHDCARIVFKHPRKSRYDVQWKQESIDIVKRRIDNFSFLQGYSYEN